MELLLDTAKIDDIKEGIEVFPVSGVTTNPSIIKKAAPAEFWKHLEEIRKIIGSKRSLHVQVTGMTCDQMVKEVETLHSRLGKDVYAKIPVSTEGLKAMQVLSAEGRRITATAIYTTFQGQAAMMSGAQYLAVYYNRMSNIDIEPNTVIENLAMLTDDFPQCKVIAASFRNIRQITDAYNHGAQACTAGYDVLKAGLAMPDIQQAVNGFRSDWESLFGNTYLYDVK